MPSTVEKFFQVLSEIVPNYKEYLNPPCDPSLFAEIENKLGEELPAAFKEFYSIADGERPYYVNIDGKTHYQRVLNLALGLKFMPLSEMFEEHSHYIGLGEDYYYNSNCISYNGNRVKSCIFFHKKWLTVAGAEADYLSLDYAPADEGAKGQVILHNTAGDTRVFLI